MKRFYAKNILIWLCLALGLFLCACGTQAGPETPDETETPLPELVISEIMSANKSFLADESGSFPDWVELCNLSDEAVELGDFTLSDGEKSWEFPQMAIGAGEYRLFLCGKGNEGRIGFSLSAKGETLSLYAPDGRLVDRLCFGEAQADESFISSGGTAVSCQYPSPGYENTEAGYTAVVSLRETPELSINEVMCFNRSYEARDGEYYDLIELKNSSDRAINLSEYCLSDSEKDRLMYPLPSVTLEPGQLYTLSCDDSVPFALSSGGEQLYLSLADGQLIDYVTLRGIPSGGSLGRMDGQNGFFYFSTASIGAENSGGCRFISSAPTLLGRDGVYNGVDSVKIELSGPGAIYYTTDGRTPDAGCQLYTDPVEVSSSMALRAVCIEEGKLPSESLDLSYIINEEHTLPVVGLVVDPEYFSGASGVYSHPGSDWERPASITLYDGDEGFSIKCGIKVHGATSRYAQSKKSFKLNFRDAYGGQLDYDLFENGVTDFSSILLRAAQEGSFSTNMRDIIMHELANQCEPGLSTQAYKYTILYINGEYWGIYALREAHSAEHFANHRQYDPEQVTMWKGRWAYDSDFEQIYRFILNNNMKDDENYRQVIDHIDVDSLIAWSIIESYSGNIDINSPNVRFYYTEEDQQLHYALVDLDLGLFSPGKFTQSIVNDYDFNKLLRGLLSNAQFKQLMVERLAEYLAGPLSQENVTAVVESLAQQLRPELERDGARWGYTPKQWERALNDYIYAVISNYGYNDYPWQFAVTARRYLSLPLDYFEQYFGDLK